MRKIASIFLLGILLFNWFGYRLVLGYWQEQSKSELEARLDVNDFDESQLIMIKIPVTHLAYYNTSPQFVRVTGSVEINGMEYKYVKRRLYNDSLELFCVPDQGTMKLRAYANDIYRMTNGLLATPGKHTGTKSVPVKNLVVDPYVVTNGVMAKVPFVHISSIFGDTSFTILSGTSLVDEQPPERLA